MYYSIATIILLVLGYGSTRKLTEEENDDLQRYCGRYAPGYNSDITTEDFKSLYGSATKRGEAPWAASISISNNFDDTAQFLGTGALISPRHIITAAHLVGMDSTDCTGKIHGKPIRRASQFVVYLNVTCATKDYCERAKRDDKFVPLKVKKIYVRGGYVGENCPAQASRNDIAVFELAHPVRFSPDIFPVCIPETNQVPKEGRDKNLKLFGFGTDPSEKTLPDVGILKSIVSNAVKCDQTDLGEIEQDASLFCTTAPNTGLSCAGDSGSSLVRKRHRKPTYEVVGILSGGAGCNDVYAEHNKNDKENDPRYVAPDILTSVAYHRKFFCKCCGICDSTKKRSKRGLERDFDSDYNHY